LHSLEYRFPAAFFAPSVKALKDGVVLTEALRQIGPGCPGTVDPEHGINEEAVVLGSASGVAFFAGQQRFDTLPLFVGDLVASHGVFARRCDTVKSLTKNNC
jgi:hypothetical protein